MPNDWKPIETAPRDGTLILAYVHKPYRVPGRIPLFHQSVMFWDDGEWQTAPGYIFRAPTHWQPLPEPPVS